MKKIMLPALALTLALSVSAQEIPERKTDRHPIMKHRMEKGRHDRQMAMKQLNLTDAQKEQFKTENQAFRKKVEDLKKNEDITVKEWKARMEKLRKEHQANMQSVFTPEQKAQLDKMKKDREAKHQDMMKKRAEHLKSSLNLTDEQSAKLEKSRQDMAVKMKTLREDKKMTPEQKREAMKALVEKQKETMQSTLTEEQLKKMKEMRKKHPAGPGKGFRGPEGQKGPKGQKGNSGTESKPAPSEKEMI